MLSVSHNKAYAQQPVLHVPMLSVSHNKALP